MLVPRVSIGFESEDFIHESATSIHLSQGFLFVVVPELPLSSPVLVSFG